MAVKVRRRASQQKPLILEGPDHFDPLSGLRAGGYFLTKSTNAAVVPPSSSDDFIPRSVMSKNARVKSLATWKIFVLVAASSLLDQPEPASETYEPILKQDESHQPELDL
ncbi:MAG TPA: hypothetical protein VE863_08675 [Pyrinomonadaceae bacterium]|jgi:hypothetical protein|nr:hypothetical protein [Pyrinomonadaceae bacterium]